MNITANYELQKPLSTDKVLISVINQNMDVIDSVMKGLSNNDTSSGLQLNTHIGNENNPHKTTKQQVGLSNVDNTSDINKPVSISQGEAINEALENAIFYTDESIGLLVNGAKADLDTIRELGDAIEESKDVLEVLNNAIGNKADKNHTHNYAGSASVGGAANTALVCTGNAATATKLATPRKINGISFDGTVDITIADNTKLDTAGDSSNVTNTFTQAGTLANLTSGEKLSVSLGKIMKLIADFIAHTTLSASASVLGHTKASAATPLVNGTANVGTDNGLYAREGHVHPTDTSRLATTGNASDVTNAFTQSGVLSNLASGEKLSVSLGKIMKAIADFIGHKGDTTHVTDGERTTWNAKQNALTIDTAMSSTSVNPVQNKVINTALGLKADVTQLTTTLNTAKTYTDDVIREADFATKQYVAQQIGQNVLKKLVVASLPTSNIDQNTIYMIAKVDAAGNDNYNEYINLNGTTSGWEWLGNTAVSLADYYKKSETNDLFFLLTNVYNGDPSTGGGSGSKVPTTYGVTQLTGQSANLKTTAKNLVGAINELFDGKSATSHTHNYAGSSSAGGASNTALACTGNAATATKLATPRKINDVSFDGTVDITINDKDTTYSFGGTKSSANGNVKMNLVAGGSGTGTQPIAINGTGATAVTTDAAGNININSTDTVYTHPTTSGNKHIPSGGSVGQILKWNSDGTAAWGAVPSGSVLIYQTAEPTSDLTLNMVWIG